MVRSISKNIHIHNVPVQFKNPITIQPQGAKNSSASNVERAEIKFVFTLFVYWNY